MIELKPGMLLCAKKTVAVTTRSWNEPKREYYVKGSVVVAPLRGTSRGDATAQVVGLMMDGEFTPSWGDDCFFREGHKSRYPEDRGVLDPSVWEVVGQLEDRLLEDFYTQAPHRKSFPLIVVMKDNKLQFDYGTWNGFHPHT
jgi:hypothetical protein